MITIDFETFCKRLAILEEICSTINEREILQRFKEEDEKLIKQGEQILLAYSNNSPHPTKATVLYRTTINDYDGFDETNISCFSYRKLPNLNRCNLPKFPVFYCSDNSSISINEALHSKDLSFPTHIYLSSWKVNTERKWKILPFVSQTLPTVNKAYEYAENSKQALFENYKDHLPYEDIKKFIEFYHDEFRKEGQYKFSSIVSYKFLHEDNGDIIFYPSVQVEAEGNNYAINPKWIDNNSISLAIVQKFRIEKNNDIFYWYLEAEGHPNLEKIQWKQL